MPYSEEGGRGDGPGQGLDERKSACLEGESNDKEGIFVVRFALPMKGPSLDKSGKHLLTASRGRGFFTEVNPWHGNPSRR